MVPFESARPEFFSVVLFFLCHNTLFFFFFLSFFLSFFFLLPFQKTLMDERGSLELSEGDGQIGETKQREVQQDNKSPRPPTMRQNSYSGSRDLVAVSVELDSSLDRFVLPSFLQLNCQSHWTSIGLFESFEKNKKTKKYKHYYHHMADQKKQKLDNILYDQH